MARFALRRTVSAFPRSRRRSGERQGGRQAAARLRGRRSVRIAGVRSGAGFALACALAVSVLPPGAAASDETGRQDIAAPLGMVKLNPFHLLYGVPASAGARVMPAGSWELVALLDMASHLRAGGAGVERVPIEGGTWRQGLALRSHGPGGGRELLAVLPAVSHTGGVFDGFIEDWHDAFGLPQGDRDRVPRDRLALLYAGGVGTPPDIDSDVHSLGDASEGVGCALASPPFPNDGVVVRAMVKLPSGDEDALAGP